MEDSDKDKGEVKEDYGRSQRRGGRHIWLPIGLVIIGGGMFLHQAGLGIPEWIFSWQMLLIVLGIVSGPFSWFPRTRMADHDIDRIVFYDGSIDSRH